MKKDFRLYISGWFIAAAVIIISPLLMALSVLLKKNIFKLVWKIIESEFNNLMQDEINNDTDLIDDVTGEFVNTNKSASSCMSCPACTNEQFWTLDSKALKCTNCQMVIMVFPTWDNIKNV